jgi:hypothetical protein
MNDALRPDLSSLLDERALVAAMLRQASALAQAQAELGHMPLRDAQSIVNTCKVDLFDVPHIMRDSLSASSQAEPPVIKHLRESVRLFNPAAAAAVYALNHPADLLCNALALVTHDVLAPMAADIQALGAVPAAAEVCLAWDRLQPVAERALRLRFLPTSAPASLPLRDVQLLAARALGLPSALSEGTEDWMSLGCELGVFTLCVQRVAGQAQAMRAPLWVAQWLTELSVHTIRPAQSRDFWRAQWPLWSTLTLAAARSLRELTCALKT